MRQQNPNISLVSICIPTYNGASYLAEALESALNQTYSNLEIVVSDDASSDGTLQIIEGYREKTSIPIHLYHHTPKGIGANWNHCVVKSRGDYIKFLFQDDVLEPNCIERMVTMAETNKDMGMVYCCRKILFDPNSGYDSIWYEKFNTLHTSWAHLDVKEGSLDGKCYLRDEKLLKPYPNKIGEPTAVLIKREVFDCVGYFSEDLKQLLDVEFWYRIMKKYSIGFVEEDLVGFRLHAHQATQVNIAHKQEMLQEGKILESKLLFNYFWFLHPKVRFYLMKRKLGWDRMMVFVTKSKGKLKKILKLHA